MGGAWVWVVAASVRGWALCARGTPHVQGGDCGWGQGKASTQGEGLGSCGTSWGALMWAVNQPIRIFSKSYIYLWVGHKTALCEG